MISFLLGLGGFALLIVGGVLGSLYLRTRRLTSIAPTDETMGKNMPSYYPRAYVIIFLVLLGVIIIVLALLSHLPI